eukprot:6201332-Pleurochrysis_carterae.AAC.1
MHACSRWCARHAAWVDAVRAHATEGVAAQLRAAQSARHASERSEAHANGRSAVAQGGGGAD